MAFNRSNYMMENGKLQSYAFPGGYPIFYITADMGTLCPKCANDNIELTSDHDDKQWYIIAADINWEDTMLHCDHCSKLVECAYGDE